MDWTSIIVAGFALVGTFGGSVLGIRQSNKVVELRINALEKKMDEHNGWVKKAIAMEQSIKSCCYRLDELEDALPRGK